MPSIRPPMLALSLLALACESATGTSEPAAWIPADARTDGHTILDAAYGQGVFVVVGLGRSVSTSPDGRTWTAQDGGFDSAITGITFSDGFGTFIAASHDDTFGRRTIATSPDGRTWTRHVTARPEPMREVACGQGVCIAVGDEGAMLRSTDLRHWEDVSFSGVGGFRWISVIYAQGQFVVTGGREQVLRSPDGRTWTRSSLGLTPDMDPLCTLGSACNDIDDISYTGELYVAVTHPTLGVWLSDDLETWIESVTGLPTLDAPRRGLWSTLSVNGETFVGGGGGKLAASRDGGRQWRILDPGFGANGIWAMAYGAGRLLVAGDHGSLATIRLQ